MEPMTNHYRAAIYIVLGSVLVGLALWHASTDANWLSLPGGLMIGYGLSQVRRLRGENA